MRVPGRAAPGRRRPRRRHRAAPGPRGASLTGALLAASLGVVLLTSGLGTWSQWRAHDQQSLGAVSAGSVSLVAAGYSVELLSRQPVGSRTFSSTTSCAAAAPYVECRVITATLGAERLIPGDTVRVIRSVTLSGAGDNLKGDLVFDAATVLHEATSVLGQGTTTSLSVTTPTGQVVTGGAGVTLPVRRASAGDFGTYQAVATLATPVDNGGARWDASLFDQVLDLGAFTVTFTQTA